MIKLDWLITVLAMAVFVVLAAWRIELPGPNYDECLDAAPAVNYVCGTSNTEPMQIDPSVISLFGRPFPVMVMTYIGSTKGLLYIPFFALFGVSAVTLRALSIVILAICFPLAYFLGLRFFDRTAARFIVAFMAVDPVFVYQLARDSGPAALQVLFKLLALTILASWWRRRKPWFFGVGMFVLGLGVWHKVDFLWVVAAITLAATLVLRKELFARLDIRTVVIGICAFLVGGAPIVAMNVATGGVTFAPMVTKFLGGSAPAGPGFVDNLLVRAGQVITIHSGEYVSQLFTSSPTGTGPFSYAMPIAAIAALPGILLVRKRNPDWLKGLAGLWIFVLTVLLLSCFSPTGLGGHHLLALVPMLHAGVGAFFASMLSVSVFSRKIRAGYCCAFLVVVSQAASLAGLTTQLERTGGTRFWSDAIYDLNDYLKEEKRYIVAMDWGFTLNLIVLSRGELSVTRAYREYLGRTVSPDRVNALLDPDALYLTHPPELESLAGSHEAFLVAASSRGFIPHLERRFLERDGVEVYRVYSLAPNPEGGE